MNDKKSLPRVQFITGSNTRLSHAEEAKQACEGGIRFIQFREKNATIEGCKRMAETTLKVCKRYNAVLIVNDYIEVAQAVEADGIHLGYNDEHPEYAREKLGDNAIIGGTGNNYDHIKQLAQKVDYFGIGPYRYTETKENLKPILGVEGYRELVSKMQKENLNIPVFAVGGIQLTDIEPLLSTGIHGIAVSSAIGSSLQPLEAAKRFVNHLYTET